MALKFFQISIRDAASGEAELNAFLLTAAQRRLH